MAKCCTGNKAKELEWAITKLGSKQVETLSVCVSLSGGHVAKIKPSIHLLNAADDALSVYVVLKWLW